MTEVKLSPMSTQSASPRVDLSKFDNSWYHPGRSTVWRAAWMFIGLPLFRSTYFLSSQARVSLLRLFGARIGQRVVIRNQVNVKYPWHLTVGNDCWIGEEAWIDNLCSVTIGSNVCISQGAYLCTGNHDWSDPAFGLRTAPIELKDGAWAGAKSVLLPGTRLGRQAIAGAGSVVSGDVPDNTIVMGNPARPVKERMIRQSQTEHLQRNPARDHEQEQIPTWQGQAL